ncbi:MAG: SpoIID/LytB domain-containing protein [Muribaculaceae bacterium]|nr:SpoIID/LytB domain-containing protein [Muribaculaceae bacterium]
MEREPHIKVGILSASQIRVDLLKEYTDENSHSAVRGPQTFTITPDGLIAWQGVEHKSVTLTPAEAEASFEVYDVVIGVNFHWERRETQRFSGSLSIIVENGKLTLINILPVEDYLMSVISSEMSATAAPEFLKAHAVISRSWLLAQIEKGKKLADSSTAYQSCTRTDDELIKWYDREDHVNFDVCADDHCQRYQGITRQSTPTVRTVIEATRGLVITDNDGELCDARFSKCCGGVFEQFENCWEPRHFHYLVARLDAADAMRFPDLTKEEKAREWILGRPEAFCNTSDTAILGQVLNNYDQETTDFYRWRVEYTQAQLSALIAERSGIDFGDIIALEPVERGTSARLIRLRIVGTKKTMTIGKELEIRRTLSTSHLYSSAFVVEPGEKDERGLPVSFTLIGAGWGHGVGLCQIGAAVMESHGYDFRQILSHYFPGSKLTTLY